MRSYNCDKCGAKKCEEVFEIKTRHIRPVIYNERGMKMKRHQLVAHICGDCFRTLRLWDYLEKVEIE